MVLALQRRCFQKYVNFFLTSTVHTWILHKIVHVDAVYFINRKGHEMIAKLLIQHEKTHVNAKIKNGDTPLHLRIR